MITDRSSVQAAKRAAKVNASRNGTKSIINQVLFNKPRLKIQTNVCSTPRETVMRALDKQIIPNIGDVVVHQCLRKAD